MKYGKMMAGVWLLWSLAMMACSDDSSTGPSLEEILAEYSVAYEFDDPANVGKDFFGKNNAVLDEDMPAVKVEDECLVLDGKSGLRVPLSDSFKSPYFVVEVRFMATDTLPLSNIFSADPPGAGVDGWMIRLDGSELRFHIRGAGDWEIFSAGKISLNEWHTVRVEFTSADMGGLTVEGYDLKITLDGKERVSEVLYSDAANLQFDLGIGYDPHHQSRYDDRFFIGKIDYIRYGNR
ncbi:Laminin G domain-containing protein [Fibrobacter sp. UWT3]|uniref:LamG domain-containing protein n=1 Tax=Fibrobacter sp. UWT3 TaxID=1896225 RepID=UPI000BC7B07B|nr:LamG domain-containing protein [Fibrobacter sp. UWT3]SOE46242.1 Laminin G domain-containing protein [Fibrobacter sp. UWT3]